MFIVPAVILLVAIVMNIAGVGLAPGIDFTGGSIVEYAVGGEFATEDVSALLKQNGFSDSVVSRVQAEDGSMTNLQIRLKLEDGQEEGDSSDQLTLLNSLLADTYEGIRFISMEYAGATSSAELIKNALKSIVAALVLMLVYIAIRFDLYSGAAALFGLCHDVLVMLAAMSFAGALFQVNSSFIAALLTIVGYSINDTIIIFDRIRENKKRLSRASNGEIVDVSVSASLSRTVNTSVTTLITLLALFILGAASIREFAFPLIIGMVAGTYSSNLLSGPLWAWLMDKKESRRQGRRAKPAPEHADA